MAAATVIKKVLSKEERVKRERARLKRIFKNLPDDVQKICDGLIVQAARLRIMLDDSWEDISINGDVEQFTQSKDAAPYERLRPVAQLFNSRDKAYQTTIKMLCDRLPDVGQREDAKDELRRFNSGG